MRMSVRKRIDVSTARVLSLAAIGWSLGGTASADIEVLSRYGSVVWTRDAFPYLDRGAADWTDEATCITPGLWQVTLPHGNQHESEATTEMVRGGIMGMYRGGEFADIDTGRELLWVRLRLTEPTTVTIEFSGSARPVPAAATASGNLTFGLIDLSTGGAVFDIFRDGSRTTGAGSIATWATQGWSRVVPAGEYDVYALADHQDVDAASGVDLADARLDFRVLFGGSACPADFNEDGFVDFFDYDDFVTCFETGECGPGRTADVNGDGFADFFDYDDYVELFERGC